MLRYYFDEHVKGPIAVQLRNRGIDVLTAQEARQADRQIDDNDQLAYATSLDRTLVTEDRHFVALSQTRIPHAGVVLLQRPLSIGEYVEYLELLARVTEPEEEQDRLVYCDW